MKQLIHIFKKDVRYLWSELALFAVTLVLYVYTELNPDMAFITLPIIAKASLPIFAAYIIARLVHAEPLPGSNQFWITRPYRYGSLLLAKLAFIVLCIGLPMFAARFVLMRIQGFPVFPGALDLAWSQLVMMLLIALPVFALASVTANLTQLFVAFVITALVGSAALQGVGEAWRLPSYYRVLFARRGEATLWVPGFLATIVLIFFCGLVLWKQYRGRTTAVSRVGIATGLVLCIGAIYATPFGVAAAVNRVFYHNPPAGSPLQVQIDMSKLQVSPVQEFFTSRVLTAPVTVTGIPDGYRVAVPSFPVTFDGAGESQTVWFRADTSGAREDSGNFPSVSLVDKGDFLAYQGKSVHGHASIDLLLFPPPLKKTVRLRTTPLNVVDGVQCYLERHPLRSLLWRVRCGMAVGWPASRSIWFTKASGERRVFTDTMPGPSFDQFSPIPFLGLDLNSVQWREAEWDGAQPQNFELRMDVAPQKLHVELNFDSVHFPAPSPE